MLTLPRRILVINLQHHGDVLLTTPVFAALKRQYPAVEIDAMVFAETAPMIQGHPDLTHIWKLPRSKDAGKGWKRLSAQVQLYRQIRQRQYDWALYPGDRWPGAWAALASGAALRVSHEIAKRDNCLWRWAFPRRLPCMTSGHMVERNLGFLRELGLQVDTRVDRCRMAFNSDDEARVRQKLTAAGIDGDYILVHPTSRWFFKCWEDDRLAEVISALAADGHKIVLTAAPAAHEMALIENLLALAPHPNVVSLAGQLTLPALAAAIAGARLFIGVDSAPMHMAAALDIPTIALFGPSNIEAWRPWSDKAIVISAADYGPLIAPGDVDTGTLERYLTNIPVEPVLEAARAQLARFSRNAHPGCRRIESEGQLPPRLSSSRESPSD